MASSYIPMSQGSRSWLEGSTGVSEGGSRVLVLQRDNRPLARLEGSTGVPWRGSGKGSRLLLIQRETSSVACLRESMVVP